MGEHDFVVGLYGRIESLGLGQPVFPVFLLLEVGFQCVFILLQFAARHQGVPDGFIEIRHVAVVNGQPFFEEFQSVFETA